MENFHALGLPRPLLQALEKMKFDKPTPIQAQAIPPALEGRDVLGTAQTGTGKTAAFAIPMLARILAHRVDQHQPPAHSYNQVQQPHHHGQRHNQPHQPGMALIMTPTRELSMQVLDAVKLMLNHAQHVKTALLIGGQSMHNQLTQLRARPRVVVGTPGRINDHLEQGSLNLSGADFLVLDETDRMLDMGFGPQIERIVKRMPKVRQTLMFSATMPDHIVKIANTYLHNPVRVAVGTINAPIAAIQQELVRLQVAEKYETLLKELRAREGSVLVFVKTKRGADRIAKKLNADKHQAVAIHGNLNQNQRNRVIQSFRDMKHRIMVATDVASRGLDIPHIEHVINYDLPQVAEDYIHRIGRTARAGKEGAAVCFITPEDADLWREIHKLLHPGEKLPPREEGGGSTHKPGYRQGSQRGRGGGGGQRNFGDRSGGQRREHGGRNEERRGDGYRGDRPRGDRPRGDAPRGDRPRSDGPRGDRPRGDAPRGDRPRGDGQRSDRQRSGGQGGGGNREDRVAGQRHRVNHNRTGFSHRKGIGGKNPR